MNVVPEAVAGNVVVLDGLLLIQDQCRGVVVGLPHLEDEGLAHPLVRTEPEFVGKKFKSKCPLDDKK